MYSYAFFVSLVMGEFLAGTLTARRHRGSAEGDGDSGSTPEAH